MSPTTEPRAVLAAIWQTRPSRRQADKKIAGVSGAIARRYDIDPVLVRVGFVVASIYGIGILLYLAAWVVLPADPNDPPSGPLANRASGTTHPVVLIAAVIAALFALMSLLHGSLELLAGFLVVAGLLYLLHQNRAERGLPGTERRGVSTATAESAPTATDQGVPPPAPGAPAVWDAPGHGEPPTPPTRRRKPLTAITIALAMLTGGVVAAIILATGSQGGVRLVAGCVLAVVALGLLVGAFIHQGRGLIGLAIPLVLITFVATRVQLNHWEDSGTLRVAPTTVAGLAESYQRGLGTVELDLTQLDLSTGGSPAVSAQPSVSPAPTPAPPSGQASPVPLPPGQPPAGPTQVTQTPSATPPGTADGLLLGTPVRTRVSMQAGDVIVKLPPNADVTVHCHADVGTVDCLGQHSDGEPGADMSDTDLGEDRAAGGRPLNIDITIGAGTVSVTRD